VTEITYTGADQSETIEVSGTYTITADGAEGGSAVSAPGGAGAEVSAQFVLQQGDVLEIVVGGVGGASGFDAGGGGGGTFVYDETTGTLLEAAGGGGGAIYPTIAGSPGQSGTAGGDGTAAGGTDGSGGSAPITGYYGGGGGGGGYDGRGSAAYPGFSPYSGQGGSGGNGGSELPGAGGAGGLGNDGEYSGAGGFGGGGGGGGAIDSGPGGGGGGGYSGGGGGGGADEASGGGGGGSFVASIATDPTATAGVNNNGNGFVEIIACYCRGTRVLTDQAEIVVEELAIGDKVITLSGEVKPIKWIGHRSLDCHRHPDPTSIWPICVAAGSFGENKPSRDLWLSPGHNIAAEGVLMPIKALQNGKTIVQHQRSTVEYWHIELDQHDIIFAEGLPAESYLDTGNRTGFVNGGAFIEAHPDFKPKHWAETCLPLVQDGAEVARTKTLLLERLKTFGQDTTSESDLHVIADGKRIEPIELGAMRFAFMLPPACSDIRLMSRTFVPAHTRAASTDTRSLGLCVNRLQIDGADVSLDDQTIFGRGWNALERRPDVRDQRWTAGDTPMPANARLIVIDLAGPGHYWQEPKDNVVALFG
jgi:hypothetical protein